MMFVNLSFSLYVIPDISYKWRGLYTGGNGYKQRIFLRVLNNLSEEKMQA